MSETSEAPKTAVETNAKKPAHEVVVEMIRKMIESLNRDTGVMERMLFLAMLSMELEILDRMIIPEKHLQETVDALRQIQADCQVASAQEYLSRILLALAPPASDATNPVVAFFEQGGSFLSEEGHKLIIDSKHSILKDAAKDIKVLIALLQARDQSADPFLRRQVLLALED